MFYLVEKKPGHAWKILLKKANLLLLDEPTNHLDMESCDSLLAACLSFPGAVIMVSHSEYFLKALATKLIVFDNDKAFIFDGDYQSFIKKWVGVMTNRVKCVALHI